MSLAILRRIITIAPKLVRRLYADRRGNILFIAAGAMVPMSVSVGFGIDYARAMRLQSQINAAADAAALAGVTGPMMKDTSAAGLTAAHDRAVAMFKGQVANLSDVAITIDATNTAFSASNDLVVTPTVLAGSLNAGRKVVVQWRAQSHNIFGSIVGADTLAISGSASSQAVQAPYMNFYLMMDVSPSMLLPTTSTGLRDISNGTAPVTSADIDTATTNKTSTYGCAFACHEQKPRNYPEKKGVLTDSIYVHDSNNYDILLDANYYASSSTATGYRVFYRYDSTNKTAYSSNGVQIGNAGSASVVSSSVSSSANLSYGVTSTVSCTGKKNGCSNGLKSSTSTNTIAVYPADGYWLTHNYSLAYPGTSNIEVRIDAERLAAQQLIPQAARQATGNGVTYNMQLFSFDWTHSGATGPVHTLTSSMTDVTKLSADSVPDLYAAQDYWYSNNSPLSGTNINDKATEAHNMLDAMYKLIPAGGNGSSADKPKQVMFLITDGVADEAIGGSRWSREFGPTEIADCTNIKTNATIAILYTQYLPDALTNDPWSQSNVAPHLSNVATALKSCASVGSDGVPLFYQVTTDQNISDALVTLFALTVQQAHLVQ